MRTLIYESRWPAHDALRKFNLRHDVSVGAIQKEHALQRIVHYENQGTARSFHYRATRRRGRQRSAPDFATGRAFKRRYRRAGYSDDVIETGPCANNKRRNRDTVAPHRGSLRSSGTPQRYAASRIKRKRYAFAVDGDDVESIAPA